MKDETRQILGQLGFKNLTGDLWQHKTRMTIVAFCDDTEPFDVGEKLIEMGERIKIAEIKNVLDIQ